MCAGKMPDKKVNNSSQCWII